MMEIIRTGKCSHRLLERGIILLTINEGETIEEADVREMREAHLKLSHGQPFAILLDATHHFTITHEARSLIASRTFAGQLKASAFVLNSLALRLAGNFYIRFHKPANPTRLFSDKGTALAWLSAQMHKYAHAGVQD
jgi:hypothetical protein